MLTADAPMELIWDVAAKTALVLVLVYGLFWTIRRFSVRLEGVGQVPGITVIHSAHLGPGRSVHLIAAGGKTLLVGATAQQVSLLAEIDGQQAELSVVASSRASTFERCFSQARALMKAASSRAAGERESEAACPKHEDGAGK